MSDDIVKTLLESLTDEQKAQFAEKLMSDINQTVSKPPTREKEIKQEEAVSSKPQSRVSEDFKVKPTENSTRKVPVRAKGNKWKDTGEKRDPDFDPAVYESMGRSERDRPKAKKVELECHVCGRTFMESPKLVYGDYHRCNRCGGR